MWVADNEPGRVPVLEVLPNHQLKLLGVLSST